MGLWGHFRWLRRTSHGGLPLRWPQELPGEYDPKGPYRPGGRGRYRNGRGPRLSLAAPGREDPSVLEGESMSNLDARNLVLAVTPFEWPNARLAVAAGRAGAIGVLDLGRDRDRALDALADTARRLSGPFGVRVPAGMPPRPAGLPGA